MLNKIKAPWKCRSLRFKAATAWLAARWVNGLIVGSDFCKGAVAPEMAGTSSWFSSNGFGAWFGVRNEHFFRPQVFACFGHSELRNKLEESALDQGVGHGDFIGVLREWLGVGQQTLRRLGGQVGIQVLALH